MPCCRKRRHECEIHKAQEERSSGFVCCNDCWIYHRASLPIPPALVGDPKERRASKSESMSSQDVLWYISWREIQCLVWINLGKQFQSLVNEFFLDPEIN